MRWNGHVGRVKEDGLALRRAPCLFFGLCVGKDGLVHGVSMDCTLAAFNTIEENVGLEALLVLFAGPWKGPFVHLFVQKGSGAKITLFVDINTVQICRQFLTDQLFI